MSKTVTADQLRKIFTAARPLMVKSLTLTDEIATVRKEATKLEIDWGAIKALLKAEILDDADGGTRLKDLIDKSETPIAYADLLGLQSKNNFAKSPTNGRTEAKPNLPPSPPPIPDKGDGAAAPAATGPTSTGIDGPVLPPPSPGTGPTNSDDPYNCIPPQFDRTRELRA